MCVCVRGGYCSGVLLTSHFEISQFLDHHSAYHVSIVFHSRLENWTMGLIVTIPYLSFNYLHNHNLLFSILPGRVAQPVKCLATDASLTADPGVTSSIPACSYTFMEIDHELISTVILPSAESFKKGCCQLQEKVCARSTV